jgi:hypothetical protein
MPEYKLRLWDGQREYFGNNNTGLGSSGNVIGYRRRAISRCQSAS